MRAVKAKKLMSNRGAVYAQKSIVLLLSSIFIFGLAENAFCQKKATKPAAQTKVAPVKQELIGKVQEIAPDKSYLVINGTKVMTDKDFIDNNIIVVSDILKLTVEKKGDKITALSSEFMFSGDAEGMAGEGSGQSY